MNRCRLLPVLAVALAAARTATADVTLDGTLGPAGALAGPDYAIPAELGRQSGPNLFHSFGRFGLDSGESATFSGPASVDNVIGRVTGGQASNIDGTLRSTIPSADLYLINPAGVMLGPDARLEVDGSFHAATAHHLDLADGGRFDAVTPDNSSLTAAPVAAFGFLDRPPAPVSVDRSVLAVPEGQGLSLVGGDVLVVDGTLYAPGGHIDLTAAGAGAVVEQTNDGLLSRGGAVPGRVEVVRTDQSLQGDGTPLSNLIATGPGAGSVHIAGGRIVLHGAWVETGPSSGTQGGAIVLDATASVIIDGGALVSNVAPDSGQGGATTIRAGDAVEVTDGASVGAYALAGGTAGEIRISSGRLLVASRGSILSDTKGTGGAGAIKIDAEHITVSGRGLITSSTRADGAGGRVEIRAPGDVTIADDGIVSSFTNAAGNAGDVVLVVDGQLVLENGGTLSASALSSGNAGNLRVQAGRIRVADSANLASLTAGSGAAGHIQVETTQLEVSNNSYFSTDTSGTGNGGDVTVHVSGPVILSGLSYLGSHSLALQGGDAGNVEVHAGELRLQDLSFIDAATNGDGNGGSVALVVDRLVLQDGSSVGSQTFGGAGEGGDIDITAGESVIVTGEHHEESAISAISVFALPGGSGGAGNLRIETPYLEVSDGGRLIGTTATSGPGGDIQIQADRLRLADHAEIQANTLGSGRGGNIDIRLTDAMTVSGGAIVATSSEAQTAGDGGHIEIHAPVLEISDNAGITVGTLGSGNAGEIRISVDRLSMHDGGGIGAPSFGAGKGGVITIDAADSVVMSNDDPSTLTFIDSTALGTGDGGAIDIRTPRLEMSGWTWIASNAESSGAGGTIHVAADALVLREGARILALAFLGSGDGGDIDIDTSSGSVQLQGTPEPGALQTEISTDVRGLAEGNAGDIRIRTGELNLSGYAWISSSSESGSGDAGNVTIVADRRVGIQGEPVSAFTGLWSRSITSGNGGSLFVSAPEISLSNRGRIDAQSLGSGRAGDIEIHADRLLLDDAFVSAFSAQTTGGTIRVNAGSTQLTHRGEITASVFGDEHSDGGNIEVTGRNLVILEGGRIVATARVGLGGRIIINNQVFLHDAASVDDVLDASSGTAGNDGTVAVNSPELDISGSLVALPGQFLDAGEELGRGCDAARAGRRSSLIVKGRAALPREPGGPGWRSPAGCRP